MNSPYPSFITDRTFVVFEMVSCSFCVLWPHLNWWIWPHFWPVMVNLSKCCVTKDYVTLSETSPQLVIITQIQDRQPLLCRHNVHPKPLIKTGIFIISYIILKIYFKDLNLYLCSGINFQTIRISNRIQWSFPISRLEDLYLNRLSAIHEKMRSYR